jgi:glycosyltransferase involved in cell wall biosynthesis
VRIALVCPHFPPQNCGVGDYTARLARELGSLGHEIGVWTGQPSPIEVNHAIQIVPMNRDNPWGRADLARIGRGISTWRADAVIVQYTPYLYARNGIQPWLPLWVMGLKRKLRKPVCVMAHELHYPVGLTPDRVVFGLPQFCIFQSLALVADQVFFSYDVVRSRYAGRYPWRAKRFHWVPVSSNIERARTNGTPILERHGIDPRVKLVLQFGGSHPTRLFDHLNAAYSRVTREIGEDRVSFVFVGMDQKAVQSKFRGKARGLGYLPAEEVSTILSRADLVLAPFMDGVSTRRGSVMAALAHGRPVVTTRGWATDPDADWDKACALVEAEDLDGFASRAAELLTHPSDASRLGQEGERVFHSRYEWSSIARRMTEKLNGSI